MVCTANSLRAYSSMVVRAFSLGIVMGSNVCCDLSPPLKGVYSASRHMSKRNDGSKVKVSRPA